MRILVTGGAGFIGSNYIRRLADGTLGGATEITVLDKLTYAGNLQNLASLSPDSFRFIEGDICDSELVSKLIKNADAIVNFAAESHVDRSISNPTEFIETNIKGVQLLLGESSKYLSKKFLQVSTDEVYGSINKGSWNEESPLLPNSPYSASKAAADLITRSYCRTFGTNVRITRSSNNYGAFQHPEKLIPLAITNVLRGKKVPIYGDGSNVRDWLHVDDNCLAIHAALTNGEAGETYNVGGGNELSNLEVVKRILSVLGKSESENINFVEDRKGHDLRYSVNVSKASTHLKFVPKVDFHKGLEQTIEWYSENTDWWISKVNH